MGNPTCGLLNKEASPWNSSSRYRACPAAIASAAVTEAVKEVDPAAGVQVDLGHKSVVVQSGVDRAKLGEAITAGWLRGRLNRVHRPGRPDRIRRDWVLEIVARGQASHLVRRVSRLLKHDKSCRELRHGPSQEALDKASQLVVSCFGRRRPAADVAIDL